MYNITSTYIDFIDERQIPVGYTGFGAKPEGVRDLEVVHANGRKLAYVVGDDGLYVFSVSDQGNFGFVTAYPSIYVTLAGSIGGDLNAFIYRGGAYIASSNGNFEIHTVLASGELEGYGYVINDTFEYKIAQSSLIEYWTNSSGEDFFAIPSPSERGLSIFSISETSGQTSYVGSAVVNSSFAQPFYNYGSAYQTLSYNFQDSTHAIIGNKTFLYLSSPDDAAVAIFTVTESGVAQTGLSVQRPDILPGFLGKSILATLEVQGNYFLMNYSGSYLYVSAIRADGSLSQISKTPWIIEPFWGEIETFSYNGRGFIITQDSITAEDGGLAIFELSSLGNLTRVASISTPFASSISQIEFFLDDDELTVIAADQLNDAILSFKVDLSQVPENETNRIFIGTASDDELSGTDGDDTFSGNSGNDTMSGMSGNDIIDGGAGIDTAAYSGNQGNYTLTLGLSSTSITDRRMGGNGTDTLIDIEFLDFDTDLLGEPFDLTIFGGTTGLTAQEFESFIELYIAYFNRAPDAVGLNFWGTAFANGTSLEEMATLFIDQEETRATYPTSLSNAEFATAVYNNVLGRIPDQAGFDFWVDVLNTGARGRDQFILSVLEGVQAGSSDRVYLDNKIDVGAYFAVHKGMSDVGNASAAMAFFDGTATGIANAVNAIDGFYADALDPTNGEFLMPLVGVLDNPFAA